MIQPNKQLGQHWLFDEGMLRSIVCSADIRDSDVVLEIGPGLGTLTAQLVQGARSVVAVEFDQQLATELPTRVKAQNLQVIHEDILRFNLNTLPKDYKVVANVPYYITSKITRLLLESSNPPSVTTLLVQKEVAQRMAARPGDMSILAVAVQYYTEAHLGDVVAAHYFTPPPQVDSQIITLVRRDSPLFPDIPTKHFFRVVRAGFSEKRKKLHNALSGGLHITKNEAETYVREAHIAKDARAEQLSLEAWRDLASVIPRDDTMML